MVALARSHRLSRRMRKLPTFAADVLEGLHATPKRVPAKYFYDAAGSQLFERITELPEYYPTRCEMRILREHAADIAKLIPAGAALVEFGSGSNKKARILLRAARAARLPTCRSISAAKWWSRRRPSCGRISRSSTCCR